MNHINLEKVLPGEIEARSFEIITEELGDTPLIPGAETCESDVSIQVRIF